MKNFFKKLAKNNRGMSLVEIICTIAILAIVGASVAGMVNVAGGTYTRGVSEVNLQESMQMIVNHIDDLLIDSVKDVTYDPVTGIMTIVGVDYSYEVARNGNNLAYTQKDLSGAVIGSEVLAENITDFSVDPSEYSKTGNVSIRLKMKDTTTNRDFSNDFTITSRNGMVGGKTVEVATSLIVAPELVMEPLQEYELDVTVLGSPATINWYVSSGNTDANTTVTKNASGKWVLKVGRDEMSPQVNLRVEATDSEGTVTATKNVLVYVRRVTGITLTYKQVSGYNLSGGAKYTVTATVTGNNLDRKYGVPNDDDYVDPRTLTWNKKWTYQETVTVWYPYSVTVYDRDNTSQLTVNTATNKEYTFTLGYNRTPDFTDLITIDSISSHASGSNKSGLAYGNVKNTIKIMKTFYNFDAGKLYRATDQAQGTCDENSVKTYIQSEQGNDAQGQLLKQFRYKIHGVDAAGNEYPWTVWIPMTEGGNAIRINEDCYMFRPDTSYDVEIRFGVKDNYGNARFPINLDPSVYTITATINRAQIKFDLKYYAPGNVYTSVNQVKTYGTQIAPTQVAVNKPISLKVYKEDQDIMGFRWDRYEKKLWLQIEKLESGTWVACTSSDYNRSPGDDGNFNNMSMERNITFKRTGTYRIKVGMQDVELVSYNGNSFNRITGQRYDISDESTGVGIFYYEVK